MAIMPAALHSAANKRQQQPTRSVVLRRLALHLLLLAVAEGKGGSCMHVPAGRWQQALCWLLL